MDNRPLTDLLQKDMGLQVSPRQGLEEIRKELTAHINQLINEDFDKLVSLLYRIDVNEHKIRRLLDQQQGENAAGLIADLILERQLQKIRSRQEFTGNTDIPEDEKW